MKTNEQINSAVIVDFKSAFEEYHESFPDPEAVVPEFSSLTRIWPNIGNGEIYELYRNTCNVSWCHRSGCLSDPYYGYQKSQRENVEPKIKTLLEEYENEKPHNEEGLERFKEYMEKSDLIRPLPGVVPGFALRNRKWGKLIVLTFV